VRTAALKLHYFLLYAVVGAYLPYVPVFLGHDLKLPDWQIGWVTGCYGLAVLLAPPVMAALADSRVPGRALLAGGYALSGAALCAFAGVDAFVPAVVLAVVFGLGYTPLTPLLDGLVFAELAKARAAGALPPPYSALRVWGSVGFMAPAFALFAVMHYGLAGGRAAMFAGAVAAGVAMLCARLLPRAGPEVRAEKLPAALAWAELRRPPTLSLIGPLVLLFAAISVFYAFHPRLVIEVGIAPEWVGMVSNLGVLAELPWMIFAAASLRRFGVRAMMLLGALCMLARMLLLAAVPGPEVAVATQILHGPAVVSLYLLPPMILDQKAAPGFRNSVQGLYAGLCYGAARVVGAGAGGHAAEYGLQWAFALAAALSGAAVLWLWLAWRDPAVEAALRGRDA
jgi:PPP family 3-phenylpropionic acid transporter